MLSFDYLVIGSGITGLSFALKAAETGSVAIVTKRGLCDSNSATAQGGVATVWSAEDSAESHVRDTLEVGHGLCSESVVRSTVAEGPARLRELIELGVAFSRSSESDRDYDLALEGGHSHRRVLHVADHTGLAIVEVLGELVRAHPRIEVLENRNAIDLLIDEKFGLTRDGPQCWGAYVLNAESGSIETLSAHATLLATGGAGKVYLYTSNPDIASGDGLAMAYRAGCRVANLEFIQFHPTCLFHPQAKSFLITEAMRGEGAVLRRPDDGQPFMANYHPKAELAPRDIVARAIDLEMKRSGYDNVLLDITGRGGDFIRERFPLIHERALSLGIDIVKDPIPVVPAAHYMCGGVLTGTHGQTSIRGLYAAGEVAMTGLHGANRLASNSLLEGLVFAHRAAFHASELIASRSETMPEIPAWQSGDAVDMEESVVITHNWDEIRRLMWNYVGIVRSDRRLKRAAARISLLREEIQEFYWDFKLAGDLLELRNLALVAELIVSSARTRRESRGLHYNVDCPLRDDSQWQRDTII